MKDRQKPLAIDLFCGCGGISTGLAAAGFEILAGVDSEPNYLSSFSHNFPHAQSLQLDLAKYSPQDFMKALQLAPGEVDLLAGGPPCQGFSKNVPRKNRYLDDPRNHLLKSFLDYCEVLLPRLILMENVAEMKNGFQQAYSEELFSRLHQAGYMVSHEVVNAADYGVPQRRRRAFFIASRDGLRLAFPKPTHTNPTSQQGLFPLPGYVTVWEAIGDLPSLKHGEGQEVCEYQSAPFSPYQRLVRNCTNRVTNHVARYLQPTQYERLDSLQPGEGLKDLPLHLQTKSGYSGAYGRLTKEMIAPTITRWVFHPGSGRWGHPIDIRTLTIREAARIQGFPDRFDFVGSFTQRAGQVGNAVPPLLAQRLAETMWHQVVSFDNSATNFSRSSWSLAIGKEKVTA
ncbi:MAG: DNA cytosine methyltransferase [Acidobacteria bacterium]|nr:DNA cytosine methyltransferase [Acidobacteriota bacterium]